MTTIYTVKTPEGERYTASYIPPGAHASLAHQKPIEVTACFVRDRLWEVSITSHALRFGVIVAKPTRQEAVDAAISMWRVRRQFAVDRGGAA